jgi:hypothetical protein
MYLGVLSDLNGMSLQQLLLQLDKKTADDVRSKGCTHPLCAEEGDGKRVLHADHYQRKPRGIVVCAECKDEFCTRFSWCCAGCRHRTTPPSLRFLNRKVYQGVVVVVATVLRSGLTPARMRTLQELVGVSRQTVLRWRALWKKLARSKLWRARCGRLPKPVKVEMLPLSWLDQAIGSAEHRVRKLLQFVDIYTGGRYSGVAV